MNKKSMNRSKKIKLFAFFTITIISVGILFNIIYASSVLKQENNKAYFLSRPQINVMSVEKVHCGNNICEPWLGETPSNCVEDCYMP